MGNNEILESDNMERVPFIPMDAVAKTKTFGEIPSTDKVMCFGRAAWEA